MHQERFRFPAHCPPPLPCWEPSLAAAGHPSARAPPTRSAHRQGGCHGHPHCLLPCPRSDRDARQRGLRDAQVRAPGEPLCGERDRGGAQLWPGRRLLLLCAPGQPPGACLGQQSGGYGRGWCVCVVVVCVWGGCSCPSFGQLETSKWARWGGVWANLTVSWMILFLWVWVWVCGGTCWPCAFHMPRGEGGVVGGGSFACPSPLLSTYGDPVSHGGGCSLTPPTSLLLHLHCNAACCSFGCAV